MIDGSPLRRDSTMVLYEMASSHCWPYLGIFLPNSIEKRAILVAGMAGWYLIDQYLFFGTTCISPNHHRAKSFHMGLATVWGYLVENKDKRMLTSMFKNYISPELIDQMVNAKQSCS